MFSYIRTSLKKINFLVRICLQVRLFLNKPLILKLRCRVYSFLNCNDLFKYLFGSNRICFNGGAYLRNTKLSLKGDNNRISISLYSKLSNCTFIIIGNDNNVDISEACNIQNTCFWLQGNANRIIIGKNTTIESAHLAITEGTQLIVGDDCMFANDVEIRTGDSHSVLSTVNKERLNAAKDIYIENHVWLTTHVRILKGVTICHDTIVGNSSIVTKNLETPYAIYAGSPATCVKVNVNWTRN